MSQHSIPKSFRFLPPLLTAALVAVSIIIGSRMSLEGLISYKPQNILLAAVGIILLYAVKSLSVVFPLSALYLVSAFWFGPLMAIVINYIGLVVCEFVPFFIGRYFGSGIVRVLPQKYPKLQKVRSMGVKNEVMLAYLLRIVSVLPGDLCSLFLGACSLNPIRYLIGSLLGLSPMMILHVLFADIFVQSLSTGILSALTPGSVVAVILLIAISVVSSVIINKKTK